MALTILLSRRSYTELQVALDSATNAKTLAMSRPAPSNPHDVCGVVVATCIGNVLKRRIQNLRAAATEP
jgi:hypothetical protein